MALNIITCLQNIVGLAEQDCPCFGTDAPLLGDIGGVDVLGDFGAEGAQAGVATARPADYNTSLSGFYLDDAQWSVPIKWTHSQKDCGAGNVWDILERARTHGLRNLISAFSVMATAKNMRKISKWSGPMAGTSHTVNLPNLKSFVGVKITPAKWKGVKGVIDKIELYIQQAGVYSVNVYADSDLTTPLNTSSIDITVGANFYGSQKLSTPLTLDFSDEYGRKVEYYVVYDRGTSDPRNLQFGCNCGKEKPWEKHIYLSGVNSDTVAELETATEGYNYSNGLRIHMTTSCGFDWLCRQWDFQAQAWDRVFAECVMLSGIQELINMHAINRNPVISLPMDVIAKKQNDIAAVLQPRIEWLANNVPLEESDCYACEPKYEVIEMLI